jgi:hypothetical protein
VLAAKAVKIPVIAVGTMPSQYGAEASVRIDAIAGQTLDTLTALVERAVAR